jgi:hypothetical protein
MRTTIRIDDELLSQVKRVAAETRQTMSQVIEQAVRESLTLRRRKSDSKLFRVPTFRGSGLRPGVNLDDSSGLLDIMEGLDASS